jgi:hypothetical protein
MTKADDKKLLAQAKDAGRKYITEQLDSEQFSDYVASQIYEAGKDPDAHFETKSKAGAMRAAKNMLIDLGHDISRDLDTSDALSDAGLSISTGYEKHVTNQDLRDAFWEGLHEVLGRKTVQNWLADEIVFRTKEYLDHRDRR